MTMVKLIQKAEKKVKAMANSDTVQRVVKSDTVQRVKNSQTVHRMSHNVNKAWESPVVKNTSFAVCVVANYVGHSFKEANSSSANDDYSTVASPSTSWDSTSQSEETMQTFTSQNSVSSQNSAKMQN